MKTSINRFGIFHSRTSVHFQRSFFLFLSFFISLQLNAQLASWDFEGGTTSASTVGADLTASAAAFGPGVGSIGFSSGNGGGDAYSANSWTNSSSFDENDYIEVSIEADECKVFRIIGFSFDERRSGTGPTQFRVDAVLTGPQGEVSEIPNLLSGALPDNTSWRTQLSPIVSIGYKKALFRIYGFAAENSTGTGTWRIDNIIFSGSVIDDDMEPIVNCSTFTPSYNQAAPPPNTPSGFPGSIPVDGMKDLTIGFPGGVSYTVDLTCISDLDGDYSEYGITLLSSVTGSSTDGCGETLTNTYAISDECDNIAIRNVVIEATFNDNEAPTVSCGEFSETFSYCPSFIGPNQVSGNWSSLNPLGTITSSAGGIFSQTIDVSACVSDDNSALANIERRVIASYAENRTDCSVTIVNEYAFRDECGNVADETVLIKFIFEDPEVAPTIDCPANITVECGDSTDPADTGMATADDDCPAPPSVTFSDSFSPACGSGTGTITRTWMANDECGNSISCDQLITIVDTQAPMVTCAEFTTRFDNGCGGTLSPNVPSGGFGPIPVDGMITVGLGVGTGATYDLDLNGCVSDNCTDGFDGLEISLVSSIVGEADCGQTLTNSYSIGDACGNVSTDLVTIVATFADDEAPVVTCDDFTATFQACPDGLGPNTPNGEWFSVRPDGTFLAASGGSFIVEVDLNTCVSDNCSNPSEFEVILVDSYAEDFVPGCTITLVNELAVRDACGNIADEVITTKVTIENVPNEPPSIDCPGDLVVECGDPTNPSATGMATGSDDCGSPSFDFADAFTPGCSSGTGMITRTWTATDGCGATTSCTQTITIVDTTPPSIDCPSDLVVECGDSTDPSATGVATGEDACGSVSFGFADIFTAGCSSGTGMIARTWTATDACGLTSTCTQIITIVDTSPPVWDLGCQIDAIYTTETGGLCPADAFISLNEGDELTINDGWTVGGVTIEPLSGCVSDNCTIDSELTITVDDITIVDDGTCSRTITVTFIADDGCDNFSEPFVCNYTFIDDTAPVFDLACQLDLVFPTSLGNGTCPADATISFSEGDELTVNDGWTVGGNTILPLSGCVSDNCTADADLTITVDDITVVDDGTCSRTITVTFIADDGCGNFSDPFVCNYTFVDDTAPEFDLACQIDAVFTTENGNVCPADATISLNEGDELTVFDGWTVGGVTIDPLNGCVSDNCTADADLTITVDDITVVDDGTCSRTITVTFIADDGCGNFSDPFVCNYTFLDDTGPEVSFNGIPDGGTYTIECDLPSDSWDPLTDIGELTITDNCSAVDIAGITEVLTQLYDGPCSGNLLTRWQQVFTVQDVCGNTTVYTLFTEIIDTTPPAFTDSPEDVTIECDETADTPELEAFDSCSEVVYNFTEVRTDGACPNSYTLTRTWTATDGCGNASNEVQIVTVEDTTPPEIQFIDGYINQYEPGQDVFVECSELGNISLLIANNAVAYDNCSGNTAVTYTLQDLGGFDCQEFGYSGAFISTWTSTDECGNTATATINWFLVDETAPVFQGLPEDACADMGNLPPVADVQAVDDCELAVLTFDQSDPIDCEGGQYIERTWTAEDACGNSTSYTQRITITAGNGPIISIDYPEIGEVMDGDLIQLPLDCSQPLEFSAEALEAAIHIVNGCGEGETLIELELMDEGNCQENGYQARYHLTVTATDACENRAEFNLTVDFVDQNPPTIEGETEITINCGDEIPMPTAVDACSEIASMTFADSAPVEVSCPDNPVAYERTWTATDACGNVATFVQSITVLDTEGPVFSGVPADACNNTGIDVVVTALNGCTGDQSEVFFDEVSSNESGCGEVLTRTWTATDACGNTSIATQQVFFTDDEAPTIEFTSDLLFGLQSGDELFLSVGDGLGDPNDPLLLTAEDVTTTDNCATLSAEVAIETTLSDDCAADGYLARYEYQFIATDPCGNSSIAKLAVYYVDNNSPDLFNVPDDETVFCSAVPMVAEVTASDDYTEEVAVRFSETQTTTAEGVLITRTWTATDDCGNTNSASQEILVVNNDLSASFSFGSDVIECNSDDNRLGVSAMGGTPPYSYQWQLTDPLEDGYITTDPTRAGILFTMGYISQTFSVLITDDNGCELLASVTVVCDFEDDEGDFFGSGDSNATSLSVYPNPANEQLLVKANELVDTPVTISLYNLFGQELLRREVDTWTVEGLTIDTRQFPNGTYVLRLAADGKEVQAREIVILH